MFDTIKFSCWKCGKELTAQSKGGDCCLNVYNYKNVPNDVARDANRHSPFICDCGESYEFKITVNLELLNSKEIICPD